MNNNQSLKIKNQNQYVQYGCGLNAPVNWINFDSSPNLVLEKFPLLGKFYAGPKMIGGKPTRMRFPENIRYGDIVKGLPIKDNSCQGIFASHVLEHLTFVDFQSALSNTFKILQPGGTFRFIVPDLRQIAIDYLQSSDPDASVQFMRETLLGKSYSSTGFRSMISNWLGNSHHLWMWDFDSLNLYLQKAGFSEIRNASFNDSEDNRFMEVEEKERFQKSVCVECRKVL